MRRNKGVLLILVSIILTTIGSIVKLIKVKILPDLFLALGVLAFVIGLAMVLMSIFRRPTN